MNYYEYYKTENDAVRERYELAVERIRNIPGENTVDEKYRDFFENQAQFISLLSEIVAISEKGAFRKLKEKDLIRINERLYDDIHTGYDLSFLNPDYIEKAIGMEYGKYLLWMGHSIRNLIPAAFSVKLEIMVTYMEVFVEIYNLFESEELSEKALKDIVYWFNHDCCEITMDYNIREMMDPDYSFGTSIVMEGDLSDPAIIYHYGSFISQNEIETAKLLSTFSDEKIESMAKTYTDGFIRGFEVLGKDLSKKNTVEILYNIGFERVVKAAIEQFEKVGLRPVIRLRSYESTPANKQYNYDHRYADAPIFDKCIKDRRVEVAKSVFEKYKILASGYAGPAVIEVYGEKPFSPKENSAALKYNDKQQKLSTEYSSEYMQVVHQYIKDEERSFTIIAYPVADIGQHYKEIFEETIKINNLDQKLYEEIQSKIINELDKGEYVEIKGMNGNNTDLKIVLQSLSNPEKETLFENCLADVNIPVGEVFTSPKLTGTCGVLHEPQIYLDGLNYIDLELKFKDGCIEQYSCKNFDSEEANIAYVKENLLHNHDTLPIGEFAIGTNTTAYVMIKKYNLAQLMTILIMEKTGPHFAVGDTCYSYEEDEKTYNPDGKQIVAKGNEISELRNTEPEKAYFNCHTDITIPYNELAAITVVTKENQRIDIIRDGKFVLEGTEKLNEPLENQ